MAKHHFQSLNFFDLPYQVMHFGSGHRFLMACWLKACQSSTNKIPQRPILQNDKDWRTQGDMRGCIFPQASTMRLALPTPYAPKTISIAESKMNHSMLQNDIV